MHFDAETIAVLLGALATITSGGAVVHARRSSQRPAGMGEDENSCREELKKVNETLVKMDGRLRDIEVALEVDHKVKEALRDAENTGRHAAVSGSSK